MYYCQKQRKRIFKNFLKFFSPLSHIIRDAKRASGISKNMLGEGVFVRFLLGFFGGSYR